MKNILNRNHCRFLASVLCFTILLSIGFLCSGCATDSPSSSDDSSGTQSTNPLEINWAMDGMMVDTQGNVISNGSLNVNGKIEKSENSDDNIYLYFTLPTTLHYILDERVEEQMPYRPVHKDEFSFYVCTAYCYSTKDSKPVAFMFALDVEAGYLIMQWENLPGQFLISSRDGNVDPQQIMNHFQAFLDRYAFAQ